MSNLKLLPVPFIIDESLFADIQQENASGFHFWSRIDKFGDLYWGISDGLKEKHEKLRSRVVRDMNKRMNILRRGRALEEGLAAERLTSVTYN
jgi:hypothetical protein